MCGEIQWSSVGGNRPAVVGFNSEGVVFENHPQSGYDSVGSAVSCVAEFGKRRKRNTINITRNGVTKLYSQAEFTQLVRDCENAYNEDLRIVVNPAIELTNHTIPIQPCPMSLSVSISEEIIGQFVRQKDIEQNCYISAIPIDGFLLFSGKRVRVTQQCCYNGK